MAERRGTKEGGRRTDIRLSVDTRITTSIPVTGASKMATGISPGCVLLEWRGGGKSADNRAQTQNSRPKANHKQQQTTQRGKNRSRIMFLFHKSSTPVLCAAQPRR